MGNTAACNGWTHAHDTPRNLANGNKWGASSKQHGFCHSFECGRNSRPYNIWQVTGKTTAQTWSRWGYVNDVNSWGTKTRVGYTGDNDSSDSADTVVGLGLDCFSSCVGHSAGNGAGHQQGSGWYFYWPQGRVSRGNADGALQGWLFVY